MRGLLHYFWLGTFSTLLLPPPRTPGPKEIFQSSAQDFAYGDTSMDALKFISRRPESRHSEEHMSNGALSHESSDV